MGRIRLIATAALVASLLVIFYGRAEANPEVTAKGPIVSRDYGYTLGDFTDIRYLIDVPVGTELDLARLPGAGMRVGAFIIRNSSVQSRSTETGDTIVTITFAAQNFSVLCEPTYVSFGPLEVFWRPRGANDWQVLRLEPAKILIAPVSLCTELPDISKAPHNLMIFSRAGIGWLLAVFGFVTLGFALFGILGVELVKSHRRLASSVLWRARQVLGRADLSEREAIAVLRKVLHHFGVTATDTAEDVRDKFSRMPFWAEYAQNAADLFEETNRVLFDGAESAPDLRPRIRNFIETLERKEVGT